MNKELISKSKIYKHARILQNGVSLLEGEIKVIEIKDDPFYYIYFKDADGDFSLNVGIISKNGIAIIINQ